MFKRILFTACLMFFVLGTIFSQPIVKATLDASEYKLGDIINVKVNLENNPGIHSIYFDLQYDRTILSFEEMRKGSIALNAGDNGELLYADNGNLADFSPARTVVSFSMKGPVLQTIGNNCLIELSYRIIGFNTQKHSFVFDNKQALDGRKVAVPNITWTNSPQFTIINPASGRFIMIKRPYENEVIHKDNVKVSLICSEGDFLVGFTNSRVPGFDSDYIPVTNGMLLNTEIPLGSNMNKITAGLYEPDPNHGTNHTLLKEHSIRVYRAPDNESVKIVEPLDHSLLNTDMADVKILSPLDYVEVNGLTASFNGEMESGSKVYRVHVWLKNGFNTLNAVAIKNAPDNIRYERNTSDWLGDTWLTDNSATWASNYYAGMFLEVNGGFAAITGNSDKMLYLDAASNDIGATGAGLAYKIRSTRENETVSSVKFKDSIQVFYQKDTSIFRFVTPIANQGFKSSTFSSLAIKGEIDSEFKTSNDPATGGPVENKVTLRVTYIPNNPLLSNQILVNDKLATISESDFGYGNATSKYVFTSDFPIPLAGLSDGEVEIIAFKNLSGDTWDDKITRIVYIDNQRLWIDLVQPNIFTYDSLDSESQIKDFNEDNPITSADNKVCVSREGEITLAAITPTIEVQSVSNFTDMAESNDGTLYGIVNVTTSLMNIYKKEIGSDQWTLVLSKAGMHGYDLCSTKIGILVGASNIPANGNSGLYLLADKKLINFSFLEASIPHVQFVENKEGTIYIYGSLFSYLYSFNIDSVEESNGEMVAMGLKSVPFRNTSNIKQFVLSNDTTTAVILTDELENNIRLYQKGSSGFEQKDTPILNKSTIIHAKSIVYAPYTRSGYDVFLLPVNAYEAQVIMENRTTSAFFRRNLVLVLENERTSDSLLGAGYQDEDFYFVYKHATGAGSFQYIVKNGQVFYDNFYPAATGSIESYTFEEGATEIKKAQESFFMTRNGSIYLGLSSHTIDSTPDTALYNIYKKYATSGSCDFNYVNDDIDGITGFSFDVDPFWLKTKENIKFRFAIKQKTGAKTSSTDVESIYNLITDLADIPVSGITVKSDDPIPKPIYTITRYFNKTLGLETFTVTFEKLQDKKYLSLHFDLKGTGQVSPGVRNLTIDKKIVAKITNVAGEKISLQVQGYIYDKTVTEVWIGNTSVKLDRNGHFSTTCDILNIAGESQINLHCENVLHERADLTFKVVVIQSENNIWDVEYAFDAVSHPLVPEPESADFTILTTRRELSLTGKYFGLVGAVLGYELYSTQPGEDKVPLKQGLLVTGDPEVNIEEFTGRILGSGYEGRRFTNQVIELLPNEQRLVLYIENPGNTRYEYKSEDGKYPVFSYSMPESEQEIVFDAAADLPLIDQTTVDSIPVTKKLSFDARVTKTAPYVFISEGNVTGQIYTLDTFEELLVRSYTPGLVFANGESETIVSVMPGNRFSIPFKATMSDAMTKDFNIAVIPTIPLYNYLKEGLRISVKKSFKDTDFIPDFKAIHPENWTPEQKKTFKNIQVKFAFKGFKGVPVPNMTRATFTVNFDKEITGYVDVLDNQYFCLKDTYGKIIDLSGINRGKNRIQWSFEYEEKVNGKVENTYLMSSSFSGKEGMEDDIFTVTDDSVTAPTKISFNPSLTDIYYNNTSTDISRNVPSVSFTKDVSMGLSFVLNDTLVWEDTENRSSFADIPLPDSRIREGRNLLDAVMTDKFGSIEKQTYTFLYDSKPPVVKIASVKMNDSYTALTQVVADVTEGNFSRGYLHYGADVISVEPVIMMRGEDSYLLVWQNLDAYGLNPATKTVAVEVQDLAGNSGTDTVNAFLSMDRPEDIDVREQEITLPLYQGEPELANEANYQSRPFEEHTKFAPAKLLEKVSVKEEVEENYNSVSKDYELIRNKAMNKIVASEGGAVEFFGEKVSLSGDYAIVGSSLAMIGSNYHQGAAYIYKRNSATGIFEQSQPRLVANDGVAYDEFGISVAISGDYVIVGSRNVDSYRGAVYIFKLNQTTGVFEQLQPRLNGGAASDLFGLSVSISGDYAVIGAFHDNSNKGAVYIYKRNQTTGIFELLQPRLVASDGLAYDSFGEVSISGDYVIVGADGVNSSRGAAYIYKRNQTTGIFELLQPRLVTNDGVTNDRFGHSVSISGDYMAIGAILVDIGSKIDQGAAYIYKRNQTTGIFELLQPRLVASDGVGQDWFGYSVAISGDYMIVGAAMVNPSRGGAAYIYKRNPTTGIFEQSQPRLVANDGNNEDMFGTSVAISGDYTLIGSYSSDIGENISQGAAYIYKYKDAHNPITGTTINVGQKKFLAYQITKDPYFNNLVTKDDLKGKIKFEYYGYKNNTATGAIEKVTSPVHYLTLDPQSEKYIEGLNYLYYMLDINALKTAFVNASSQIPFQPTDFVYDWATLGIAYTGLPHPEVFSPYDIYVTGESDTLLSQVDVFDSGYMGTTQGTGYIEVNPNLKYPIANRDVELANNVDKLSACFWLRIEDESALDEQYSSIYKRLVTFKNASGTELFHLGYKGSSLDLIDETLGSPRSLFGNSLMEPLSVGLNSWALISVRIDPVNGKLHIFTYDKATGNTDSRVVDIEPSTLISSLTQDASFYFGPKTDNFNTGFYSIANPFYIERLLTDEELTRIGNLYNVNEDEDPLFSSRSYTFQDSTSDFAADDYNLRKIGGESGHVDQSNNADYTEANTAGSLKASSAHPNLFEINENRVVLKDAGPILYNTSTSTAPDSFTITPAEGKTGRYIFGDKSSNFGLGLDRYYSISGSASAITPGKSFLVMSINGQEQKMELYGGKFHFIYDNKNMLTPHEVKVYIETSAPVTLAYDMILNKGNYVLPTEDGLTTTAASTKFAFGVSGNIDFWYKPLIANKDGLVNYPVVLFDSEYVKIGAGVSEVDNAARYYAQIKSAGGVWKELLTNIKVDYSWQHLQLAYDQEHKVVYFYINGKIAASSEGQDLPVFGSLKGIMPQGDNVYIGCDMAKIVFAEGYIDNVSISRFYDTSTYTDNTPVNLVYNQALNRVELDSNPPEVTEEEYSIYETDGTQYPSGSAFPISTSNLPAGRFTVKATMKIKGHKFTQMLTFNVDNKPRFNLTSRTPIVFLGNNSDISFTFEYDHSYQFRTESLKYVGVAVKINNSQYLGKPVFLVQNFIDQDPDTWLIGRVTANGSLEGWTSCEAGNDGKLTITFPGVNPQSDIECKYEYFYFTNSFPGVEYFNNETNAPFTDGLIDKDGIIPLASLATPVIESKTYDDEGQNPDVYEYMLVTGIEGDKGYPGDLFKGITIVYEAARIETPVINVTGEVRLTTTEDDNAYKARIYYDDMFGENYGTYNCTLKLKYNNSIYDTKTDIPLVWRKRAPLETELLRSLEITEFSLLSLDKISDKANFYLQYAANGIGGIKYTLEIKQKNNTTRPISDQPLGDEGIVIIEDITVPEEDFTVAVYLSAEGFSPSATLELGNYTDPPEIYLTNTVDSEISYNDVFFSWKGSYDGQYLEDIAYSYNFDGKGWCTANKGWKSIRFYNLDDGEHSFFVKSVYDGSESSPEGTTFFVDIHKPLFNSALIEPRKLYDAKGVFYAVSVTGKEGAVSDVSLDRITVSGGQRVTLGKNGSFVCDMIPVTVDGIGYIVLTATDKVGNYTDHQIQVENNITEIVFPEINRRIVYSPLTIVGRISDSITCGLDIYLKDPFTNASSDGTFTGWKRATINPDRTFFIENVFVNPGTKEMPIWTTLTLVSVSETGKAFERTIDLSANEILLPITMDLDMHASESGGTNTEVNINCTANLDNISSWSVDFDGDGIYDDIEIVDKPSSDEARIFTRTHLYSSMDLIYPRVRVITLDGNFFSVSDTLIIHEKIKEASNKLVGNPLSMSSVRMPDKSDRVFILRETENGKVIDVHDIGRNDAYISNKLFTIPMDTLPIEGEPNEFGIDDAVNVRAIDATHLVIGSNTAGVGTIHEIAANTQGNFTVIRSATLTGEINEITLDAFRVFVSFTNRNYFAVMPITGRIIDTSSIVDSVPGLSNTLPIGEKCGIAKDEMGLLVADFYNQRIVRLSNSLSMAEQFGDIGIGEKEFLTPSIIKVFENRIFVYDRNRHDIQVFDLNFTPVCTLDYRTETGAYNYLEAAFFDEIADIEIVTRGKGDMTIYYALIASRSMNKCALLRLPQWKDLSVQVRNNKIAFLGDHEVYTARPDGSDLRKILSSDSLPRIEGAVDYPALSADGRLLAFTSRLDLYIAKYDALEVTGNGDIYDRIYVYDIEKKTLDRITLGDIQGYEIERPVFNSGGNKLAFSAKAEGGKWQLYTCDITTQTIGKVISSDENTRFPYYSPDDRYIVFTTDYDRDEDIEIVDTKNVSVRFKVTKNNARDSLPVWSSTYPSEIANDELQIKSKIAYVSESQFRKGLCYVYVKEKQGAELQIVTKAGLPIGTNPLNDPDNIMPIGAEGDYPCFTGDGTALVLEQSNGENVTLRKYDFTVADENNRLSNMNLSDGANRPSGMKNMITDFIAKNVNGDEIELSWNRYTENDIFYTIQYKLNASSSDPSEIKTSSQTCATIHGLEMGTTYKVRVCIIENSEVVAASQWKDVETPMVAAKPSYEIDKNNPYLIRLHAWQPDDEEAQKWKFSWIMDNNPISVDTAADYAYEFATSGTKTIQLKASTTDDNDISEPFTVDIRSDIEPFIEAVLGENSGSVDLSCERSKGNKINFSTAAWTITGPGGNMIQLSGPAVTAQLNGFTRKITVLLTLQRIPVNGQNATDIIVAKKVIDLDLKALKPIITIKTDEINKRLIHFSGQNSSGNIDWYRAQWVLFANENVLFEAKEVATFDYLFPERNEDTVYTVSLTVPSKNNGITETVSQFVSVEAHAIEPDITYQIISLEQGGKSIGQKIFFDCTKSKGSDIDFTQARWSVPIASDYGEQVVQAGPTATYNLVNIGEDMVIEVALTLARRGNTDPVTITKLIRVSGAEAQAAELIVNKTIEKSGTGNVLILDVLKSTGPNIDWGRTEWLLDGQYTRKGPTARYDVSASADGEIVTITCTLYRFGAPAPQVVTEQITLGEATLKPFINYEQLSPAQPNVFKLDVLKTRGVNIDWERTRWYINDGSQDVVVKQGAVITHAFAIAEKQMGYPVIVELFFRNDTKPFTAYKSIPVVGNELIPSITQSITDDSAPHIVEFSAETSLGSNIDWTQVKWTFMDTAETQYGSVVAHTFPINSLNKTYTVALTLMRRLSNGQTETKTSRTTVTIGKDDIKPVISAKYYDKYLVLSAEKSTGRSLLLDRAMWSFPGEGDGNSTSTSSSKNDSSASTSTSTSNSYSTSNSQTGLMCRRYISDANTKIRVTLLVYRMTKDGGTEGRSITVEIKPSDATVNETNPGGKDYDVK